MSEVKESTETIYKKQLEEMVKKVETKEQLLEVIDSIVNKQDHDYGTIAVGTFQAMMATFNYVNRSPNGGITGFQAIFLGWAFVDEFMLSCRNKPKKIINYGDLLYPKYGNKFEKVISKETHEWLIKEAKKHLEDDSIHAHEDVIKHWQNVANGEIPFGFTLEKEDESEG